MYAYFYHCSNCLFYVCSGYYIYRVFHSCPTRRSSDLRRNRLFSVLRRPCLGMTPSQKTALPHKVSRMNGANACPRVVDRKSTRLNSSHVAISYAVFCLKKKKHTLRRKSKITSNPL